MGVRLIDSALFGEQFDGAAMCAIFSDEAVIRSWMQVEAALTRAESRTGMIPSEAADRITACSVYRPSVERISAAISGMAGAG